MEKKRKKQRFSKWIAGTLAVVMFLTAGAYLLTKKRIEDYIYIPVDREEQLLLAKGKYLYPTKTYDVVEVVNVEKEYFAVWSTDETAKIVDKDGNIIFDTKSFTAWDQVERGFAVTAGEKQSVVVADTNKEKLIETTYDEVQIHRSGKYFLGINYVWADDPVGTYSRYTVESFEGEILKESDMPMELTTDEGYMVYWTEPVSEQYEADGGTYGLLNLNTDELEYIAGPEEQLKDRAFGYTIVSKKYPAGEGYNYGGYQLLDRNFEMAMDGQVFWDVLVFENHIGGTALEEVYFDEKNEIPDDIRDLFRPEIYDSEGRIIFEGEIGQELLDLHEDMVVTTKIMEGPNKHFYYRLEEGGSGND